MKCAEDALGVFRVSQSKSIMRSSHKGISDFFFASSRQVILPHLGTVIIRLGLVAPGLTIEHLTLTIRYRHSRKVKQEFLSHHSFTNHRHRGNRSKPKLRELIIHIQEMPAGLVTTLTLAVIIGLGESYTVHGKSQRLLGILVHLVAIDTVSVDFTTNRNNLSQVLCQSFYMGNVRRKSLGPGLRTQCPHPS